MSVETNMSLKRNWAKGRRLEFLEGHLPAYQSALRQSRSRGTEYADSVVNKYFALFSWRLPMSEEPPPGPPVDPSMPLVDEDLTEEETQTKGLVISKMKKSIHAWLDYRTKKVDKSLIRRSDAQPEPYAILLSRLAGLDQKPGKLLSGWQHWSKHNFDQHKADFEKYFNSSGKVEKQRATARQAFTRALFDKLSDEDQAYHNQAAIEEHAAAQKAFNDKKAAPPSEDPNERQLAIDRLGSFFGPILEGIGNTLGMHISVLVGGPEPRKNGQINVISMHHGVNRAAVPKNWATADKAKYKAVTQAFIEYLETCYTKEDREARSLPQADPAVNGSLDSNERDASPSLPRSGDENSNSRTSPKPRSPSPKPKKTRSRKRTAKKSKKSKKSKRRRTDSDVDSDTEHSVSSSSDNEDEDIPLPADTVMIGDRVVRQLPFMAPPRNAPPQKAQSRPRPRLIQASDHATTSHGDPVITDSPLAPIAATRQVATTTDNSRAPIAASPHHDDPVPTSTATSTGDNAMVLDGADDVVADEPFTVDPAVPDVTTSMTAPVPLSGDPVPTSSATLTDDNAMVIDEPSTVDPAVPDITTSTASTTAPIPPGDSAIKSDWPVWFKDGYRPLEKASLGIEWEQLLVKYVDLEAHSDFVNPKGPVHALASNKRPAEVGRWISCARKPLPVIDDIHKFAKSFWAWWKGLQPEWRDVGQTPGILTSIHQQGDGSWSALKKPGQNGFLTVLSTLSWWGQTLRVGKAGEAEMDEWFAAVADVDWVLAQILNELRKEGELN